LVSPPRLWANSDQGELDGTSVSINVRPKQAQDVAVGHPGNVILWRKPIP